MAARKAKSVAGRVKTAVKKAPSAAKSAAKKTHAVAHKAAAVGVAIEKIGRFVESGAVAVDTAVTDIERPKRRTRR